MKKVLKVILFIISSVILLSFNQAEARGMGYRSTGKVSFQSYKAVVTASKLLIRKTPSSGGKIVGTYYKGNVIDIIGASGKFLKTSKGYIYSSYVAKYIPAKPDTYIRINEDTPLLLTVNGNEDERYAVNGKVFKVIEQNTGFYKIKIGKTYGYIPAAKVSILKGYTPKNKVTLGWIYINGKQYNQRYMEGEGNYVNKNSASTGLDVISPTWFEITGGDNSPIDVEDRGDRNFSRIAHRNGYEVWGRLYEDNPARAKQLFSDAALSSSVIDKILKFSEDYDLDGINVDFEGLGISNKDGFTAFVSVLSQKLKAKGLTVSIDITKPEISVYNFYDRAALSKYADYMILMAYGEHGSSLKEAGPVSSYQWTERAIADSISQGVPKDKLILGVPFYTFDYAVVDVNPTYDSIVLLKKGDAYSSMTADESLKLKDVTYGTFKYVSATDSWYTVNDEESGSTFYIPVSSGTIVKANTIRRFVVGSESLKLQTIEERLMQYGGERNYDSVSKQYVGEYIKDNLKHVVWIEDKDTMAWRMDLISKYGLKGAGAWQLYWETPGVLEVVKSKLK